MKTLLSLTLITGGVILASTVLVARQVEAPEWEAHTIDSLERQRREQGRPYLSFLRVPELHVGLYELAAGAQDRQQPHSEGEVYHVLKGRASLEVSDERVDVSAGSVVYVKAGVRHRFVDIVEDLQVLVFFASQ